MGRMKSRGVLAGVAAITVALGLAQAGRAQAGAATAMEQAEPQLVIVDTDIGDDIDDAFALALLLRSPEVKVLGVTTAFGDTELRAQLVDRFLAAVGRQEIPVEAGVATQANNRFTQAAYARAWPARAHDNAVDFLLDQIRAQPGKITLIAIGPLFNVEAAIARDPDTFRKLRRVVMMGGSIDRGYDDGNPAAQAPPSAEWNIHCDPAGARALLASGVPVFMMPLDSTQIRLTQEQLGTILAHGSPLTDQLTLLYHQWTGAGPWKMPTLYDPVAAAYAIRPDLCPATPIRLEVDDNGFTRPVAGEPNAQVCLKSDESGLVGFLMGRILSETGQ